MKARKKGFEDAQEHIIFKGKNGAILCLLYAQLFEKTPHTGQLFAKP